jgi:hypothetical protein
MRIRIRDLFDPGSGMEKFESWIRNKHPGIATLAFEPRNVAEFLITLPYI